MRSRYLLFLVIILLGIPSTRCVILCRWREKGWFELYGVVEQDGYFALVGRLHRDMRCGSGWIQTHRDLPDRDVVYFLDPGRIYLDSSGHWTVTTDSVWVIAEGEARLPRAAGVFRAPDGTWWLRVPRWNCPGGMDLVAFDSLFHREVDRIPGGDLPAFREDTMVYVRRGVEEDTLMLHRPGETDSMVGVIPGWISRLMVGPDGKIYGVRSGLNFVPGGAFRLEDDSLRMIGGGDLSLKGDTLVLDEGERWVLLDTALDVLGDISPPAGPAYADFVIRATVWAWGADGMIWTDEFGLLLCQGGPGKPWRCVRQIQLHDVPTYELPPPPL